MSNSTFCLSRTVGGRVGFAIVYSEDAVQWHSKKNECPCFDGVSAMVAFWLISPIVSAVLAAALFAVVR